MVTVSIPFSTTFRVSIFLPVSSKRVDVVVLLMPAPTPLDAPASAGFERLLEDEEENVVKDDAVQAANGSAAILAKKLNPGVAKPCPKPLNKPRDPNGLKGSG